jgi:hypothetical protein
VGIFFDWGILWGLSHHPPITMINRIPNRAKLRMMLASRCLQALMSRGVRNGKHASGSLSGIRRKRVTDHKSFKDSGNLAGRLV